MILPYITPWKYKSLKQCFILYECRNQNLKVYFIYIKYVKLLISVTNKFVHCIVYRLFSVIKSFYTYHTVHVRYDLGILPWSHTHMISLQDIVLLVQLKAWHPPPPLAKSKWVSIPLLIGLPDLDGALEPFLFFMKYTKLAQRLCSARNFKLNWGFVCSWVKCKTTTLLLVVQYCAMNEGLLHHDVVSWLIIGWGDSTLAFVR